MNFETEDRLSEALHDLAGTQPFEPDAASIERRGRRARRRARLAGGGIGVGVAAAVAVVAVAGTGAAHSARTTHLQATGTTPAGPSTTAGANQTANHAAGPLAALSGALLAGTSQPAGDATVILRTTHNGGQTVTVADLYADNGQYYFAPSRSGLPAQVAGHHAQTHAGLLAREIAAAKYADTGSLTTARQMMEDAPLAPGATPPTTNRAQAIADQQTGVDASETWLWNDCMQALVTGSGQPQVRAGVLRILSTMPEVSVTHTTTAGQATLTLKAVSPATPAGTSDSLVITADDGIPVTDVQTGVNPSTVDYQVSRVSLANVAAGRI